ncbi:MAG: FecR domain-containing protein [Betaproteobacteria bacterium]|nr:FecR domain-containing protein [Betaproteobacteria bacterium]
MKNSISFRDHAVHGMKLLVCLAALTASAWAQAASGTFTYVTGGVFVETQGRRVPATRGMEVNSGDLVVTQANGMAQLAMVDQAKLSLRFNSQLRIESYPSSATGQEGATLSLLRGTLRTFTGLLTPSNREKYLMKTRVATVGIRGSGNILNHEEDNGTPITINHTIEGSHIVSSLSGSFAPIITFPNDTIRIEIGKPPERIPTPPAIVAAATTMTSKEAPPAATSTASSAAAGSTSGGSSGGTTGGPTDPNANSAATAAATTTSTSTGTNAASTLTGAGAGTTISTSTAAVVPPVSPVDTTGLRDVVVVANGNTSNAQTLTTQMTLDNGAVRAYQGYAGAQGGSSVNISGGTAAEVQTLNLGSGAQIVLGRWDNTNNVVMSGFNGQAQGPAHFIYGTSGFPAYLSDVLTGTASYTRVGATTPTDNFGSLGTLTSALFDVNFTQRTLNTTIGISMGANAGNPATTWTLQANGLPFAFNTFLAIAGINLTITNNTNGQNSTSGALFGTLEGSFVGAALNGVILGYGFSDLTGLRERDVNGVIAFQGPAQQTNVAYRDGIVSDPTLSLAPATYIRSYTTTDRATEVNLDADGRAISFTAPFVQNGQIAGHLGYTSNVARVVDNGTDPVTGLSWGRWTGGQVVAGNQNVDLAGRSLHYIFGPIQTAPVALPLTGTGTYDVVGSTHPTDLAGNVGTMNSATLNANFSNKTVDTSVNVTIAGQTWNAAATAVPIYRDQYFSAYGGAPGANRPAQLVITCAPSCTPLNAPGSIDGFFTGKTGQGAGMMYNINNTIAGAVAFARRGG